jgi:glucose-1-phosphate adenylyltransferase
MLFTTSPMQHLLGRQALAAPQQSSFIDMSRVATLILGGGEGQRLAPLTYTNCKPAICFGGKYRLIDIPMSNALNSGCSKIFVITQFLSASLHKHIFNTYRIGSFFPGSIELLAAEQRPNQKTWFEGTADAVRQNLDYIHEISADYFLILSGDQLYNLDFQKMVQFGKETNADLVVAALPVILTDAKRMGLLKLNEDRFITEFREKPQKKEELDHMRLSDFTLKQMGQSVDKNKQYLGSMGIYLFKRQALIDLLQNDLREDFGKHLIPTQVAKGNAAAYLYDGYWEDIGTVESFFHANIALTAPNPAFNCYDEKNPIFAYQNNLPPPKISNTQIKDSIICEGSIVEAEKIQNSILGSRSVIKSGCVIRNSYIMGNDFYNAPAPSETIPAERYIGEDCVIDHAIIDKHVYLGKGVQLTNKTRRKNYNSDQICIRDGIIVVNRGAYLPDGFVL